MKYLLALVVAFAFAAPAAAQHAHGTQKGPNGGQMEDVAGVHAELLVSGNRITINVFDEGNKPVPTKGFTASALIVLGSDRETLTLSASGESALTPPAKPPPMAERIEAVLRLLDWVHLSPWGTAKNLRETIMEQEYNQLNHATWDCKYHVVFTPKYRKKVLFGKIKRQLGQVFHDLARRKECRIEEGHLMPDHVHMLISIPPKYAVAQVIGYMKGKSSIWIAQNVERRMRNFLGHKFWARGYFVTTVGRDEELIRAYIKNQELADRQLDQLEIKLSAS